MARVQAFDWAEIIPNIRRFVDKCCTGKHKSSTAGMHIGSLNQRFRPMAACTLYCEKSFAFYTNTFAFK